MSHSIPFKLGAASLGAAAALAGLGTLSAAHAGTQSRVTAPTDTVVTTHQQTPLPTSSDKVTVLSRHLPGGGYVVSGSVSLVGFGASDYTRCQLALDDAQLAASTALVGNGAAPGNHGDGALVVPMTMQSGVAVPSGGGTLTLRCWHDHAGTSPYVDGGPVLVAHRAGALRLVTR
jgi:hypothetical protein